MSETVIETMDRRAREHRDWLNENAPEVFEEQNHLDEGSSERAILALGKANRK